jgi:hypothetical protein
MRHRAFCTRSCHASFYLHRCVVCEKELPPGKHNRKLCKSAKCRAEYRRFPHVYAFTGNVQQPLKTPIKPGTETRVVAGQISPTASNRSRVMNGSPRSARDLFEAALNEAACCFAKALWALQPGTGT